MLNLEVTRFVPVSQEEIYRYFVEPRLIERWSAPAGMTLRIPYYDAKVGGRYRYEHTTHAGIYTCEGHVVEIVPGEKLRMIDEWVKDPAGNILMQNLPCEVIFRKVGIGTEISVRQTNFQNEQMRSECERSWNQCLDKLQNLVKVMYRQHAGSDEQSMRI